MEMDHYFIYTKKVHKEYKNYNLLTKLKLQLIMNVVKGIFFYFVSNLGWLDHDLRNQIYIVAPGLTDHC